MLLTEFNLEDAKEVWEEEAMERGREEGLKEGMKEGRENGLKEGHKNGLREGEDYGLIKQMAGASYSHWRMDSGDWWKAIFRKKGEQGN